VHPFSAIARHLTRRGAYEPETRAALARLLGPGDTFLDIGANEGIISAVAGTIVGDTGRVISVEPQRALSELIRVNVGLNGVRNLHIVHGAVGGEDGETGKLHLYPWVNCGEASIVRPYRFSRRTQAFRYASPECILADADVDTL
jgi:Protein-L-isoaspartate(D-aspartate) O-methyltransferase (PCMT)